MSKNLKTKLGVATFLIISFLCFCPHAAIADFYVIPTATGTIKPSQIVELFTQPIVQDSSADVHKKTYTNTDAGVFTVPAGMVLIIKTMLIISGSPGSGQNLIELSQGGVVREAWVVKNDRTTSLQLRPGLVIAPEYALSVKNNLSSAGSISVHLFGYVTHDR
jgi:hypothetical protein